jgi:hypothetical protein
MTGAYVARDIRMRVMPPLLAFNDGIVRQILGTFDNIDERARQRANNFYNDYPADEYTDPGEVAEWAHDHGLAWYETMVSLRQSMRNLLAAGLFHLIEQQLGVLTLDCAYERVRDTKLEIVRTWYCNNLGLDLSTLPSWNAIDELRLVANTVKHAEGGSADKLRERRPDLFRDPALEFLRAEWERYGSTDIQEALSAPLAGEGLFVAEEHLKSYAQSAKSLFEEIADVCEQHGDDHFPLTDVQQ